MCGEGVLLGATPSNTVLQGHQRDASLCPTIVAVVSLYIGLSSLIIAIGLELIPNRVEALIHIYTK